MPYQNQLLLHRNAHKTLKIMEKKMSKKKKKSRNMNQAEKSVQTREDKKAAVLGTDKKEGGVNNIIIIVVAVIAVGSIIYFVKGKDRNIYTESPKATNVQYNNQSNTGSNKAAVKQVSQNTSTKVVEYDTKLFADGKAKYFQYRDGNTLIKYFILKSSDGIIRAAFDACDVCWREGKGYQQQGDNMVCRNCGQRFASVLVNEVKGGCNPAPLKRAIQGNKLVIRVSDIQEGGMYFNSGRS